MVKIIFCDMDGTLLTNENKLPEGFDEAVASGAPAEGAEIPNVEIYYNSLNNASARVYAIVSTMLGNYARPFTVNVPQDDGQRFDQATDDSIGAMVWSKILPMLSIILSLPKMVSPEDATLGFNYTTSDYLVLLLIILGSVLIMASAVSLLSALAKDVKNAGTMVTPFMLVVMLAGLLPMFQDGASTSMAIYLIPFYNSIEVMTAVFAHEMQWTSVIVTTAANVVYTGIAIWGLTRMFNSEKVMFSR